MSESTDEGAVVSYGHKIPPFQQVFPRLFRAGLQILSDAQVREAVATLPEAHRNALGDFLGEEGIAQLAEGMAPEKVEIVTSSYTKPGSTTLDDFKRVYPDIMLRLHNTLRADQLGTFIQGLRAEDIASQSLFFGNEGRAKVFSQLRPDILRAVLDHTEDWVFLETGKRAVQQMKGYACTLYKQERVGNKLQDQETIELKLRHEPRAIYMKWLKGPFKGRELLYNEALLGKNKLRVREGGMLGIVPVTIAIDAVVARRGTKHLVNEVGLGHIVQLIEHDYLRAAPKGHIKRVNHGIVDLDGVKVYKVESILPRDRSHRYYCYRMVHYTDYLRALEIKSEVFNFDDQLDEAYYYKDVNASPGFSDADFDPRNKRYHL